MKAEGYGELAWDVHSYVPRPANMRIWIYRAGILYDVDDRSMVLAELQHRARVVVWIGDSRDSGGVGCALGECVAKISTLYSSINS